MRVSNMPSTSNGHKKREAHAEGTALQSTQVHTPIFRGTICQVSYKLLLRRCHTLGIASSAVWDCALVEDVQALAKRHYHALARRYHPDVYARRKAARNGPLPKITGRMFRLITRAYEWIMGLPRWQSISPFYWKPVTEAALPAALERPALALGRGWHEVYQGW